MKTSELITKILNEDDFQIPEDIKYKEKLRLEPIKSLAYLKKGDLESYKKSYFHAGTRDFPEYCEGKLISELCDTLEIGKKDFANHFEKIYNSKLLEFEKINPDMNSFLLNLNLNLLIKNGATAQQIFLKELMTENQIIEEYKPLTKTTPFKNLTKFKTLKYLPKKYLNDLKNLEKYETDNSKKIDSQHNPPFEHIARAILQQIYKKTNIYSNAKKEEIEKILNNLNQKEYTWEDKTIFQNNKKDVTNFLASKSKFPNETKKLSELLILSRNDFYKSIDFDFVNIPLPQPHFFTRRGFNDLF